MVCEIKEDDACLSSQSACGSIGIRLRCRVQDALAFAHIHDNDAPAFGIFEGNITLQPARILWLNRRIPMLLKTLDYFGNRVLMVNVEHQQIITRVTADEENY
jgi:hypothetical protein